MIKESDGSLNHSQQRRLACWAKYLIAHRYKEPPLIPVSEKAQLDTTPLEMEVSRAIGFR